MTFSSSSWRKPRLFWNPLSVMNFWSGKWTSWTGILTLIRNRLSLWMKRRPRWRFLWWEGPWRIRRPGSLRRLKSLMRSWRLLRICLIMSWMCLLTPLITSIMTGLRRIGSCWLKVLVKSWFWSRSSWISTCLSLKPSERKTFSTEKISLSRKKWKFLKNDIGYKKCKNLVIWSIILNFICQIS